MVSRKDLRFLTTYWQVEWAVNLWNSATNRVKNKNEKIQNKYNTPAVNNYKSNLNLTTYNSRYPGFDENDYKKLEQWAINRWLTWEQKTQFMDEAYQYYYPQVLNQHWLNKRAEEINKMAAENGGSILNGNKQAEMNMKIIDLAQTAKRVRGFAYDYPDEQIIDAMANEIPDGQQLLVNYLNNWDDTILYRAWLKKTDAQTKAEQYNKAKENINKALVQNWKQLSDDWLKYLRDYNVMFQAVDEARLEWMGQGMSDDELLLNLIYASPELQQLEQELWTLNLDSWDKAILWIVDDTSWAIRPERHQLTNTVRDWLWWNSDTPATINDIAEEIYVRDNMDGQTWKNAKANWRNWWDSIAKFGYRLPKDNRNWAVDSDIARFWAKLFWMSDEEIDEKIKNIKSENINKVKLFNEMTDKEQQDYKKQIWLDPIVENYYNDQWIVESLFNGNPEWAWYKSVWETTWNIDMLAWIWASIINPAFWLAIMGTDTYARENQEAFENLINAQTSQWVSYEDAYKNASEWAVLVWAINTAIELWLEKVLWWVETTTAGNIKDIATKWLNKEVSDMIARRWILGMLGQWLQTQARSSLEEWLEEVFQQLTQNVAASGYDPNQEITEWLWTAFESWALNPMNLLAWGTDLIKNSDKIENAMYNSAYDAGVMSRNIVDAIHNPKSIIGNIKNRFNNLNNWIIGNPETIQWNTMVENTTINRDGDKATFKEELYSIDPTLKRNLQNNPYSAEVWQRTKDYIDKNGRPERSNDVAKQLIVDVADKVQQKLMEKMEEWGEKWKLYQAIDNAGYEVDLSELRDWWLDEILEKYGIEIEEKEMWDGTTKTVLNFDKTAIDWGEASNINKIYKWIKSTNTPMSEVEFRTRLKQSMQDMVNFNPNNRDQAWRKKWDTPGDKVIKWILKAANDLAHSQIPELADLDSIYSEWVEFMDDVSDWLVYKDAAKRGVIKDNVYQIIKNLDEPSRRQMVNRLEKLIPGIKEEVSAINQMPKVIDHYYNPSKLQKWLTSETLKTVWSVWGLPGYLMLKWWGEKLSWKIDKLKSEAWDKVLSETSEEWKAKMREIQDRIENNKALTQQQANFLKNLSERIEKATQQIETPSDTAISENVNETAWDQAQELYNKGDENLSPNSEQMTEVKSYTAEELWLPPVSATMLKNLDRNKYIPVEDPTTKKVVFYKVEDLKKIPITQNGKPVTWDEDNTATNKPVTLTVNEADNMSRDELITRIREVYDTNNPNRWTPSEIEDFLIDEMWMSVEESNSLLKEAIDNPWSFENQSEYDKYFSNRKNEIRDIVSDMKQWDKIHVSQENWHWYIISKLDWWRYRVEYDNSSASELMWIEDVNYLLEQSWDRLDYDFDNVDRYTVTEWEWNIPVEENPDTDEENDFSDQWWVDENIDEDTLEAQWVKQYADNSYKPSITMTEKEINSKYAGKTQIEMKKELENQMRKMEFGDRIMITDVSRWNERTLILEKWQRDGSDRWNLMDVNGNLIDDSKYLGNITFSLRVKDLWEIYSNREAKKKYQKEYDKARKDIEKEKIERQKQREREEKAKIKAEKEELKWEKDTINNILDRVWHDIGDEWDWDWYKKMKKKDVLVYVKDQVLDEIGESRKDWVEFKTEWSEIEKLIKKFVNDKMK